MIEQLNSDSDFRVFTDVATTEELAAFAQDFHPNGRYDVRAGVELFDIAQRTRLTQPNAPNTGILDPFEDYIQAMNSLTKANESLRGWLVHGHPQLAEALSLAYITECRAALNSLFLRMTYNGISRYARSIEHRKSMSIEERNAYLEQLSGTNFVLCDPVSFIGYYQQATQEDERDEVIDTFVYAQRAFGRSGIDTAAFFSKRGIEDRPTIYIPIRFANSQWFTHYLQHEMCHATSFMTDNRSGFSELHDSPTQLLVRYVLANEGWNERQTRIELGLNPEDSTGSYNELVGIINYLLYCTSTQLWADAYSPLNSHDPQRAIETRSKLFAALDTEFGDHFFERLDVNTGLYGIQYGFDVAAHDHMIYGTFPNFDPRELPQRYAALDPSACEPSFMEKTVTPKAPEN